MDIPARELVVGDVIVLESGDRIPADMRLLEANSCYAEESALTGESVPVGKHAMSIASEDLAARRSAQHWLYGNDGHTGHSERHRYSYRYGDGDGQDRGPDPADRFDGNAVAAPIGAAWQNTDCRRASD